MKNSAFIEQVRLYIEDDNIKEALDYVCVCIKNKKLKDPFSDDLIILKSQYKTLENDFKICHLIGRNDYEIDIARIKNAILSLAKTISKTSIFIDDGIYSIDKPIRLFLEEGKLDEALIGFQRFFDLISTNQDEFASLQKLQNSPQGSDKISSNITKIVEDLEDKIPIFIQCENLPVIDQVITDQVQILERALKKLLRHSYSDISFFKSGNSGWFFRAKKLYPEQDVVINIFKVTKTNDLPDKEEINKIVNFKFNNVIKIIDSNFECLPAYVIVDYISGITLSEALKMFGGFPLRDALEIMRQLVKVLYHIRQKNILHTHIRPSKIIIDEDGSPMISSLDIIKFNKDDLRSLTRFKEECQYMSQEMLDMTIDTNNIKDVEKSDQFSLGLLLLEMIGGKPLFQAKTVADIFEKRRKYYLNPSKCIDDALQNQQCGKQLTNVLKKMLAKNPEDRYRDLSDVISVLDKISIQQISESPLLQSFHKCYKRNLNLTEKFYKNLFGKLRGFEHHFKSLERQYMMLRFAIYVVFEIEKKEEILKKILNSEKHKQFIDLSIFQIFLETLRDTVRDLLADEWDEETMMEAWNDKIEKTLAVIERYLEENRKVEVLEPQLQ